MASTESATKLSGVLASLSETLVEFRTESAEIESKFYALVEEIVQLDPLTNTSTTPVETAPVNSLAVECLENLDRSLAEQREEFVGKQDQLANDVGQLKELVDRQGQLFAAWIKSTTKAQQGKTPRKGAKKSMEDQVLSDVFAQFEELSGATAVNGPTT